MPLLCAFPGIIHRGGKSPARTSFGVVRFLHMRDDQPQRVAGLDIAEYSWGFMVRQAEPLRVHQLNNTASAILELCDGHSTVAEIADGVADAFRLEAPPLAEVAACVAELRRIG